MEDYSEFDDLFLPARVGDLAPEFEGVQAYHQGEFKRLSLSDYAGKWVVLFFYPRDFTFICPTEIQEFGRLYDQFRSLDCEVIGASTDSEYAHQAWYETDDRLKGTPFPIIADTTQELSASYNVLDVDGSAQRGTFIIDPEGVLKFMLISADSVGRNIEDTLRVVQALQTGERCPVNWKPGETTLG